MHKKRVKLTVIDNNIEVLFPLIISYEPITLLFDNYIEFSSTSIIILPVLNKQERYIYILEPDDITDNTVIFNKVSEVSDKFYNNFFIEFTFDFELALYNKHEEHKYIDIIRNINRQELYSTKNKLNEIFSRDEVENRELVLCLLDINSKIDEILYILKPDEKLENSIPAKSIYIGEEGIFALVFNKLDEKDFLILKATVRDSSGFFKFAVKCRYDLFYQKGDNYLYRCLFEGLDSELEDKVIKFVFRRDREILKEINNM